MSLLTLIHETFPESRTAGAELYVWTRRGEILAGRVRSYDDRGMVLETAHGRVLVISRSIVAVSDRREALKPATTETPPTAP